MSATQTSVEAFHSSQTTITGLQLKCLRLLRTHGPCTARELCEASGEAIPIQKRLPELVTRGLADRVGERTCKVTGKSATVWAASSGDNSPQNEPITSTFRAAGISPLSATPRPSPSVPSETSGVLFKVVCGCGTANGRTCDKCKVVYCKATGHEKHRCAQ